MMCARITAMDTNSSLKAGTFPHSRPEGVSRTQQDF